MTSPDATLFVRPPQGPLCWLFPELRALVRNVEGFDVRDLDREALTGAQLLAALRDGERTRRISIEGGPRGMVLYRLLATALRGQRSAPELEVTHDYSLVEEWHERQGLEEHLAVLADSEETPIPLLPIPVDHELERRMARLLGRMGALCAQDPRPVPFFLSAPPAAEEDSIETRLPPSWWGLLPGDRYPPLVRKAWHALLRRLYPERFFRFLAFENHALAGVDLYEEFLRGRFLMGGEEAAPREHEHATVIVLCGADCAATTLHATALQMHLASRGLRVRTHALLRQGPFDDAMSDLTRLCDGGKNLHLWRLQHLFGAFDALKHFCACLEEDLERNDVLILDSTMVAHHVFARGRLHHDPWIRELLRALPAPTRSFLLDHPGEPEASIQYSVARDSHALRDAAEQEAMTVLDLGEPFERIQARLRREVDACLEEGR